MAEAETVEKNLPRWLRKAYGLKNENKMEQIFIRARDMGFTAADILRGYHEHRENKKLI